MLTVINFVVLGIAFFFPTWIGVFCVIASLIIPDAVPLVDEIVGTAWVLRKMLRVSPEAVGKQVLNESKDSILEQVSVGSCTNENFKEMATSTTKTLGMDVFGKGDSSNQ